MNKTKLVPVGIVAALILGGLALGVSLVKILPAPVAREAAVERSTTTYYVTNGAANLVISGTVYTVTNGQVALDDSLYSKYKDLIDNGVLVQTTATGSGVFVNSGLLRVGSGAVADFQSGSIVTLATIISGNTRYNGLPTFAQGLNSSVPVTGNLKGNVVGNVTGNVVGNLTGNVTGNVTGDLIGNVTGNMTGAATIPKGGLTVNGLCIPPPT